MLKNDYKEGKTNVIKMQDIETKVLKTFFSSLYGGYVLNAIYADDLLILADKYQIYWMKVGQIAFTNF